MIISPLHLKTFIVPHYFIGFYLQKVFNEWPLKFLPYIMCLWSYIIHSDFSPFVSVICCICGIADFSTRIFIIFQRHVKFCLLEINLVCLFSKIQAYIMYYTSTLENQWYQQERKQGILKRWNHKIMIVY